MATPAEKFAARRLVTKLRRIGELVPRPCAVCGAAKVDAHHPDYSKPAEVVWLCRRHHTAIRERAPKQQKLPLVRDYGKGKYGPRRQRIIQLLSAGTPRAEIARLVGCSAQFVVYVKTYSQL